MKATRVIAHSYMYDNNGCGWRLKEVVIRNSLVKDYFELLAEWDYFVHSLCILQHLYPIRRYNIRMIPERGEM